MPSGALLNFWPRDHEDKCNDFLSRNRSLTSGPVKFMTQNRNVTSHLLWLLSLTFLSRSGLMLEQKKGGVEFSKIYTPYIIVTNIGRAQREREESGSSKVKLKRVLIHHFMPWQCCWYNDNISRGLPTVCGRPTNCGLVPFLCTQNGKLAQLKGNWHSRWTKDSFSLDPKCMHIEIEFVSSEFSEHFNHN